MNKLKLTYFDFDGGRGEPARLAMHIGGIPFEDIRFASKDFQEVRTLIRVRVAINPVSRIDFAHSPLCFFGCQCGSLP